MPVRCDRAPRRSGQSGQASTAAGSSSGEARIRRFPPAGWIEYRRGWLDGSATDYMLAELQRGIAWHARAIRLFGRRVTQPRLVAFQGDRGARYRYSGTEWEAEDWHPQIFRLLDPLREVTGVRFNSVLCNLYRDGQDAMGWHADDEPELGPNPVIAALSLGASRRFVVRRRSDRGTKWELSPEHGSLLVMAGDLQRHWQHQVPRMRRVDAVRINLTFRRIRSDG